MPDNELREQVETPASFLKFFNVFIELKCKKQRKIRKATLGCLDGKENCWKKKSISDTLF